MSTIPQPPAPSKWAREAAKELANQYFHQTASEKEVLFAAIIQRHHAAAQAETVALLQSNLNFLRGYRDFVSCQPMVMNSVVADIEAQINRLRTHLAQLKEGAP